MKVERGELRKKRSKLKIDNIMKRFFSLIVLTLTVLISSAQSDQFPTVTPTDMSIAIHIGHRGQRIYAAGEGKLLCDSLMSYQIHGAVKTQASNWSIRTSGGTMNANDTNTVPALLCRVLKAYQTMNFTALASCYDSPSAAELNTLLKTDSIKIKFLMAMANISHFELQVMYNTPSATYLFVKICYHDNTQSLALFLAQQTEQGWKLISGEDKSDLGYNLLVYLTNHQAYNLISSNDIDNDGIPNGNDPCPCSPSHCE